MYCGAPQGPAVPSAVGVRFSPGVSGQDLAAMDQGRLRAAGTAPALGPGHLPAGERNSTFVHE